MKNDFRISPVYLLTIAALKCLLILYVGILGSPGLLQNCLWLLVCHVLF